MKFHNNHERIDVFERFLRMMNRNFFTISKLDVKYDLKVQVLKDACRAVIQFMFTQVEHHFGNDLKHQDDHNQYDEEH